MQFEAKLDWYYIEYTMGHQQVPSWLWWPPWWPPQRSPALIYMKFGHIQPKREGARQLPMSSHACHACGNHCISRRSRPWLASARSNHAHSARAWFCTGGEKDRPGEHRNCIINLPTVFPSEIFFFKGEMNFERKQKHLHPVNQTHTNCLFEQHQPTLKKGEKNRRLLFMDDIWYTGGKVTRKYIKPLRCAWRGHMPGYRMSLRWSPHLWDTLYSNVNDFRVV